MCECAHIVCASPHGQVDVEYEFSGFSCLLTTCAQNRKDGKIYYIYIDFFKCALGSTSFTKRTDSQVQPNRYATSIDNENVGPDVHSFQLSFPPSGRRHLSIRNNNTAISINNTDSRVLENSSKGLLQYAGFRRLARLVQERIFSLYIVRSIRIDNTIVIEAMSIQCNI